MPDIERCIARTKVKEYLEFIGEQDPLFWNVFASEMKARELVDPDPEPEREVIKEMDYEEAHKFGNSICQFGKHRGTAYADIPYEYLAYIVDANIKLARYVRYRAQLEPGTF